MKSLRTTGKASTHDVRAENTRLLLQRISNGRGAISRADLIRLTGLNTGTVSAVVSELRDRQLVREVGFGPSAGGKPPVLLDLDDEPHTILGVQLSRSGYRIAAVSLRGEILMRREGGIEVETAVDTLVAAVKEMAGTINRSVLAVGVAVPGVVDDNGCLTKSVTMHWTDYDMTQMLAKRLEYPVHLINDSDACALAEVTLSDDKTPSLMALYIGDGVGAGLILDGGLFQGDTFAAGEVGHLNLRTHTLRCECGRVGCLEASSRISVLTGQPQSLQLTPHGETPAGHLDKRAARRGARNIAALLDLVYELIDVRRTVICGPVCTLGTELLDYIREALAANHPYMGGEITVDYSALADDGALLGAAASATHKELGLLWSMVAP